METPTTPIEKIYEAWTAVTDARVEIQPGSDLDSGRAYVTSSDGAKRYTVTWRDKGKIYTSSDSATLWRRYPGYPVVAVLMVQQRLPFAEKMASLFSDINWTVLNKTHKRNYAAAVADVESQRGIDPAEAHKEASEALMALNNLGITIKRK